MSQKRKLTVYMGRFSPFHRGHAEVLLRALKASENVLVIVGSVDQPRRIKNPWSFSERSKLINAWYENLSDDPRLIGKLTIASARDWVYNNELWLAAIQTTIHAFAEDKIRDQPIYITGSDRDSSTFYLKMFPAPKYELDLVPENREVSSFLSATKIRDMYFGETFNGANLASQDIDLLMKSFLPIETQDFLRSFKKSDDYKNLLGEYNVIQDRKVSKRLYFKDDAGNEVPYRYPIKDQTVDAVVIQSGNILLVRRRAAPGKGLWALPGGHLNEYEWMLDGAIRELYEETRLAVPKEILYGSLVFDQRFEHPDRSEVGRVISQAFCFKLPDIVNADGQQMLPSIKGSDDAEKAAWFPIGDALAMSSMLFDDHHAIIEIFVSRLTQESNQRSKKLN